ncbi:MAG: hypothetical protein R3268_12725, partial [Acidiferrobacterales bacterium]|nr:hypothetical protein [Acidiferrobacterales bacterium]
MRQGGMSEVTKLPPDAFVSAISKVKWANQHIRNMEAVFQSAIESDEKTVTIEDDPDSPDGVRLTINWAPILHVLPLLRMAAGDAVHNLRSALDHLAYAIVLAVDKPNDRLYFPMDVDRNSFVNQSSFREIKRVAPDIASFILDEIKPYGAGNPFVMLNQLDRADKHRFLLVHSSSAAVQIFMVENDNKIPDEAADCIILVADPTRTPAAGSRAATHNENYRKAVFDIQFDKGL